MAAPSAQKLPEIKRSLGAGPGEIIGKDNVLDMTKMSACSFSTARLRNLPKNYSNVCIDSLGCSCGRVRGNRCSNLNTTAKLDITHLVDRSEGGALT